jgi:hypothetical protein
VSDYNSSYTGAQLDDAIQKFNTTYKDTTGADALAGDIRQGKKAVTGAGLITGTLIEVENPDYEYHHLVNAFGTFIGERWQEMTSSPFSLTNIKALIKGTTIYVINSTYIYAYDILTGTWSPEATIPTVRSGNAVALVGDLIYIMGGYNIGYKYQCEVYDTVNKTWTTKAALTSGNGRYDLHACALGDFIYLNGGQLEGAGPHQRYTISTNTWGAITAGPNLSRQAACNVGTKNYYFGGYSLSIKGRVDAYDISTGTWASKVALPTARMYSYAVNINGKVYVIGGQPTASTSSDVNEEYDTDMNTWQAKQAHPVALYQHSAVAFGLSVIVIGGTGNTSGNRKYESINKYAYENDNLGYPLAIQQYDLIKVNNPIDVKNLVEVQLIPADQEHIFKKKGPAVIYSDFSPLTATVKRNKYV